MRGFGTSPLELMACEAMLQGLCYLDEFVYSARFVVGTPTALPATGTNTVQIQINDDADFISQMNNATVIASDHDCEPCPNMLVNIVRAGSGREVMNQPQHIQNIMGNFWSGNFPAYKPMPGLIQKKNTLTVQIQNLSSDAPDLVEIAFIGFKVFYTQNQNGEVGNRKAIFHAGV